MYFDEIPTPLASTETLPEIKSNYINEKYNIFMAWLSIVWTE